MSPWILLVLSGALLVGPWMLMPVRRSDQEVRGVLRLLWGINALFCDFWYHLEIEGMAPLPEHGPAILISNHTCGVDSMLLQAASRRVLGFVIAKEYYEYWAFRPICRLLGCIPVRRDGHDLSATRAALRALEQGRVVPIFPEGRILPTSGRELGEPRSGVAFLVLHARVPVIPAYIWGTPETSDIWQAMRMPSRAHVIFGSPIDVADLAPDGSTDRATLAKVSESLMGSIRELHDRVQTQDRESPGTGLGGEGSATNGPDVARSSDGTSGAIPGDRPTLPTT